MEGRRNDGVKAEEEEEEEDGEGHCSSGWNWRP